MSQSRQEPRVWKALVGTEEIRLWKISAGAKEWLWVDVSPRWSVQEAQSDSLHYAPGSRSLAQRG